MDKTIIEKLEQERSELNALINHGWEFEVEGYHTELVPRRGLWGCLLPRRRRTVKARQKYRISEPTLGTLDRLSAEWIELAIDEERLKGTEAIEEARTMAARHARRMARIVALAVLGSDVLKPTPVKGGAVHYEEDRRALDDLTDLFFHSIKPSELFRLTMTINAMCNLGGFYSLYSIDVRRPDNRGPCRGWEVWPGTRQNWPASLTASAEAGKLAGYPRRGATAYAPRHSARDE